jgi:hypothetical protein
MIPFLFGSALVYASLVCVSIAFAEQRAHGLWLVLTGAMVPVLAIWLVAELTNAVSPRRLFEGRVRALWRRLVAGGIAGALGACAGVVTLALLDSELSDALLMGLTAAAAGAMVVLPMRRRRPGRCVHCDYDLAGSMLLRGEPRCPECGEPTMPRGVRVTAALRVCRRPHRHAVDRWSDLQATPGQRGGRAALG